MRLWLWLCGTVRSCRGDAHGHCSELQGQQLSQTLRLSLGLIAIVAVRVLALTATDIFTITSITSATSVTSITSSSVSLVANSSLAQSRRRC